MRKFCRYGFQRIPVRRGENNSALIFYILLTFNKRSSKRLKTYFILFHSLYIDPPNIIFSTSLSKHIY